MPTFSSGILKVAWKLTHSGQKGSKITQGQGTPANESGMDKNCPKI
jgi:hypothetical protein